MRKNKLIELLQSIEGNPEVVFWNGFVGDYQNISKDIQKHTLVKHSKEFLKRVIEHQTKKELSDEALKVRFAKQQWEFPNQFVDDKEYRDWYGNHKKKIAVLCPTERGKMTFDRAGDINY